MLSAIEECTRSTVLSQARSVLLNCPWFNVDFSRYGVGSHIQNGSSVSFDITYHEVKVNLIEVFYNDKCLYNSNVATIAPFGDVHTCWIPDHDRTYTYSILCIPHIAFAFRIIIPHLRRGSLHECHEHLLQAGYGDVLCQS